MTQHSAYPLCWPIGRPRAKSTAVSKFETSFEKARKNLIKELELLGATNQILSTNIQLRLDGYPFANKAQPTDRGVAVYFTHRGRPMVFTCDRWNTVGDNIHAIALTIGALRGIARWGSSDMVESAFTGFTALPPPGQDTARGWRTVLGFTEGDRPSLDDAERAYRRLSMDHHPDRPNGDQDLFIELNNARDQARKELS